ncbi:MAG: glycosyltransferase family 2 protein [Clostridia bacterium]|nr:glycosyltransferase family 2 protein [Clostridia bacterium]
MFFSVIVPIYKVEEYLPTCVESVLGQTFSDFELILVDDGSPDACPKICDDYAKKDDRIKVVHKENGGLVSARKAGAAIARGEFIFNLDSDDAIEKDTLEEAHRIIQETNCEIVSFAYRWVENEKTIKITDDGLAEGLYTEKEIEENIYPKILLDQNMNHISYYLAGKAVKRELLLPHQQKVIDGITLGEDLCCVIPCYLDAKRVYISKKVTYLYTVRYTSLSKSFQSGQIRLVEKFILEISKKNTEKILDFQEQLCRYSCFMCFAILAVAAEGNHFKSIKELKKLICDSVHREKIEKAKFENITVKSKIAIYLMKKNLYTLAFCFLNLCKNIKEFKRRLFHEA